MYSLSSMYSKVKGMAGKILFNPLGIYDVKKNLDTAAAEVKSALTSPAAKITASITTGTVVWGGLSAGLTSASVVTGAAILGAVGDELKISAQIGAAGGGLLGGGIALVAGAVSAHSYYRAGFFDNKAPTEKNIEEGSEVSKEEDGTKSSCTFYPCGLIGFALVGDMIGYGLLLDVASSTMSLPDSIVYAVLGSTVLAVSTPCVLGAFVCLAACCLPASCLFTDPPEAEKVNGFTVVTSEPSEPPMLGSGSSI